MPTSDDQAVREAMENFGLSRATIYGREYLIRERVISESDKFEVTVGEIFFDQDVPGCWSQSFVIHYGEGQTLKLEVGSEMVIEYSKVEASFDAMEALPENCAALLVTFDGSKRYLVKDQKIVWDN